jgi:hypothetical protein
MIDEEAWLKDALARAIPALSKCGGVNRSVTQGVEEAFRRANRMRVLQELLVEIRVENARLFEEMQWLILEVNQVRGGIKK